jgi:Flp pilus assembly CpaF family ATPase
MERSSLPKALLERLGVPGVTNVVALHTRRTQELAKRVRSIVELTRRLNPDRVIVGELVG